MRRTVRLLYPTPFLDRYAYQRIWWRGGWDVDPPPDLEPAEAALLVRSRPDRRKRIKVDVPWWITGTLSFVIGLFDPATRYMQRHSPSRGSRRWAMRRVPAPALRMPREEVEEMVAPHEATLRAAERRYGAQVKACARELVRTGTTVARLPNAQLAGPHRRLSAADSQHLGNCGTGWVVTRR
jgi:hypothetical protein